MEHWSVEHRAFAVGTYFKNNDSVLTQRIFRRHFNIHRNECSYIWNKNQLMSLFQFYLYIAGSLHVSGPQAHPQESSHSCSHNDWFSVCTALAVCSVIQSTRPEQYRHWTNGCVDSCVNSPEDGPVGPKHVEIRQYMNKIQIVTSVGFYSICWKDARYKRLKKRVFLIAVLLSLRISQEQGVWKETKDNSGFETEHQGRSGSNFFQHAATSDAELPEKLVRMC